MVSWIGFLICNKIDFQPKLIKSYWEEHFILFKGKIHQDDVSIVKIYAPNTRALIFVKESLIKLKLLIKPHTLIVGDFIIPLSPMNRSSRQRLNRKIMKLTKVMIQIDLRVIYKIFHLENDILS